MVIGNLFVPTYMGIKTQKIYHVPYNFGRTFGLVGMLVGLFVLAGMIGNSLGVRIISIAVIGVIVFLVYLQVFRSRGLVKKIVPIPRKATDMAS